MADNVVLLDSPFKAKRRNSKDLTTPKGRVAAASKDLIIQKGISGSLDCVAANFSGGIEGFINYARCSADPKIARVVEIWDDLSDTVKKTTSLIAITREVGIDQFECGGAVVAIAMKYSKLEGALIASQFIPKVMTANAEEACKPEGIADRKMFMEATGLLPTNKGVSISQQFTVNSNSDGPPDFSSNIVDGAAALRFNERPVIDVEALNSED